MSDAAPAHAHVGVRIATALATLLVAAALVSPIARGASGTTTVTVTVASATNLDASTCAADTLGVTDMGTVLPATSTVTSADCVLSFGSSNDTAMVRLSQADAYGVSMFSTTSGQLDSSFDGDGQQVTSITPANQEDWGTSLAVQSDGKYVVAGSCNMGGWQGCLARYTSAGALDATFDTDGLQSVLIGVGGRINSVAMQSDGKIVIAGGCASGGATDDDLCVARLASDGSLDTTFDTDGKVMTPVATGGRNDTGVSLAVQSDGGLIVAGNCDMGGATGIDICLARYTTSGALDTTFDTDGKVTTAIGPGTNSDYGVSVAIQADGKSVVAGYCDMGAGTGVDVCVERYTTAGALDTSFDSDGMLTTAVGAGAVADNGVGVALQADGKIMVGGHCTTAGGGYDLCAIRYTSGGSLDTTYDTDGVQTAAVGPGAAPDYVSSITIQGDNRSVVAGNCDTGGTTGRDFCLARFTATGALDTTFDGDGKLTTTFSVGNNEDDALSVKTVDGALVVSGRCTTPSWYDFCIARYGARGTFAQYANGTTDWDQGTSTFGACLRSVAAATADWTTTGACTATDGANWNAMPTVPSKVAHTTTNGATATASLRFGARTATNQPPGAYIAPVTIDVLAPNT